MNKSEIQAEEAFLIKNREAIRKFNKDIQTEEYLKQLKEIEEKNKITSDSYLRDKHVKKLH